MLKRLVLLVLLLNAVTLLWAQAPPAGESPLAKARRLAFSGREHRAEALAVLEDYLKQDPTDSDARTFYGIVLSWEGRYDEARQQLQEVLALHPNHGDAAPALVRVELWSDHPARAEELAAAYLEQKKKDTDMLLLLARAQRNENHYKEALATLDELLLIDPSNQDARHMRRTLTIDSWHWEASATHSTDFLGKGRDPQNEDAWQARGPTRFGSLIGRLSRSDRFSEVSYQIEADFYPRFRPGTYAYFNLGASPDQILYPKYRVGADLYQSVGHGFELSGGYRRLQFSDDTNIFTWAVYKYKGDWLLMGRMYLTPDSLGTSRTVVAGARYFLGSEGTHDYIEVRFSRGNSLALARTTLDIVGLNSTRVTLEVDKTIGHFAIDLKGGAGYEELAPGDKLNRFTVQGSLYYRF
jgi:YaiO family outer membrane protein